MNTIQANPAIIAAQVAQAKVEACLDERKSFRLEAGAGSGKTYSLVAALRKVISEQGRSLVRAGQRVACITYTEVARDEIATEVEDHPAILVQTIHAFSWSFIAPFQPAIRSVLSDLESRMDAIKEAGGIGNRPITYDHGFFRITDNEISLGHDDVPVILAKLLSIQKFKRLLTQQFPIIFIDEYQDTNRHFMISLETNVFNNNGGPIVGLFGDHWQTIYQSEYELAAYSVIGIDKGCNFRSAQPIVDVLNRLRPELPQVVSDPHLPGEARFFHTNLYEGQRTQTSHSKNDLPPEIAKSAMANLRVRLENEGWAREKTKVLMLTHSALAAEQGYPGIVEVFKGRNDQFAKKEDPVIQLLAETVEPMCAAYSSGNYGEMFRIYGGGPAIRCHKDKVAWRSDMDQLLKLRREGTIGQVIDHLKNTNRPPLTSRITKREDDLAALNGEPIPEEMGSLIRHAGLRNVPYVEVVEAVRFIDGFTPFATQHSVKGAEFQNVLVVLGGGWNHYNWPQLFEQLSSENVEKKHLKAYYRSRNLFYVSISRPMTRLAVLATQTLSDSALNAVTYLFGSSRVIELPSSQLGK
ncbi:UvrD-helicase domain-containing protein [Methylobacterium sp. Leaf88]|uniref:UvrD-helicase domain-containing protein n=1 Tax=Methylobacterium sp. Leaf88 TaxID=1736244 RepID=UPI0009E7FD5A|nr:UvrD-helicase domain-containing protein [Methylobacterium sp. Leaf88]